MGNSLSEPGIQEQPVFEEPTTKAEPPDEYAFLTAESPTLRAAFNERVLPEKVVLICYLHGTIFTTTQFTKPSININKISAVTPGVCNFMNKSHLLHYYNTIRSAINIAIRHVSVDGAIVKTIIDYTTQLLKGDNLLGSREITRKHDPVYLKLFEYQEANMFENTSFPGGSEIIDKLFESDDLFKYLLLMTIDGKEHINIFDDLKSMDKFVDQRTIFYVLALIMV